MGGLFVYKGGGVDGSSLLSASGLRPVLIFYPVRDKAKQFDQSSQGIHPVRLESSLCAQRALWYLAIN